MVGWEVRKCAWWWQTVTFTGGGGTDRLHRIIITSLIIESDWPVPVPCLPGTKDEVMRIKFYFSLWDMMSAHSQVGSFLWYISLVLYFEGLLLLLLEA